MAYGLPKVLESSGGKILAYETWSNRARAHYCKQKAVSTELQRARQEIEKLEKRKQQERSRMKLGFYTALERNRKGFP